MLSFAPESRGRLARLPLILVVAALAPALAACGGNDEEPTAAATTEATASTTTESAGAETETTETETDAQPSADGCEPVDAPEPRSEEPDQPKPSPARLTGKATVTMTTNCGRFTIRLDTKRQPKTAASFYSLARSKFYDGLTFHRLADGFVIQGGDPLGSGSGGPGYSIEETPPADAAYTRGVVAMAKTGAEPAGTSGSQFFVVTGDDTGLPPDYAIVGEVTSGMDTVERIAAIGSSGPPNDTPLQPVVIERAVAKRG
ncbi:MAG: peptidylprolyl isomerase [Patulibacter sp.]|nr:peptidylprolyl isomerase [Patulibacter sp.]